MNLSGLLPILDNSTEFGKLLERLDARGQQPRLAILDAAKPFTIAALHRRADRPILVLTAHAERAKGIFDQLRAWVQDPSVIRLFPEPDALPYERVAWDMSTVRERLGVLAQLREYRGQDRHNGDCQAPVVVACAQAVMQKTISPSEFDTLSHTIRKGDTVDLNQLLASWVRMGFEAAPVVEVPGTFSRRGGIIDIFAPAAELPARIDLFGSEVESIRLFDPATQRSVRLVESVTITPPREVMGALLVREAAGMRSRAAGGSSYLSELQIDESHGSAPGDVFEEELAQLERGEVPDAAEFYAGFIKGATIFDYLPARALLVVDDPEEVRQMVSDLSEQGEKLRSAQVERGDLPADFPTPYHDWPKLEKAMESRSRLDMTLDDGGLPEIEVDNPRPSPGIRADELDLVFNPTPTYGGRLRKVVEDIGKLLKARTSVIVTSQQSRRLAEILEESDIPARPVERIEVLPDGGLTLVHGTLAEGWRLNIGESLSLAVLTDREIFGVSKPRRAMRNRTPSAKINRQAFLSELSVGDYVVHVEHGIGRFSGLKRMSLDGAEKEYLILDYAEADRLYVPMDQIDRVNRYIGMSEHIPALTRLGTQEWARVKERVKKSVQNIAVELLAVYSSREVVEGFAFSPDSVWQQELEASFPYVETPDQLEAIQEVKADMQKPKPMDRLLCGDVGYGKTEVALRAAFKAVSDGKQVAVLVPTTVLAQQHFETFKERMGAFPVIVEVLSRFRSDKEQKAVIEALNQGKVDICIGTHRLLQKDVIFKDLGLLIIDEEQRFGVAHKELLKKMRTEVDVLTLTATPIPRTLHMSLAGVRDMSTIETPPEERLPIKTYVTGYDDNLVRQAIIKELDRDGQVFFVHNRVENIAHVANRLMDLVPEANIAVGHGQMAESQLEKVMTDFAAGRVDILVCSTIIESGLDMPNVNTLIVNDADRFGLAQLYQLRGRVGRGANRAYAYFLYKKNKRLTEQAQKRLKTIFHATELGAGFRIAMKDLEIRGAGNLLGVEQSGHMSAIGFDLYCRLLAQAVAELKAKRAGEPGREVKDILTEAPSFPSIDLQLDALIDEKYISDYATRLGFYQRLAHVAELEEVEEMAQEMWDRFGEYPEPVRNLLYILTVKLLAARAGARSVVEEDGQIVIKFGATIPAGGDRSRLQQVGGSALRIGNMQLRLDHNRLGHRWRTVLQAVLEFMAKPATAA